MTSQSPFEPWPLAWATDQVDVFADSLLESPLETALDSLLRELAPPRWPPLLAGADIITDIWNAVKRLVSFPVDLAGWVWDRWTGLWNRAWDVLQWFWDNYIHPKLQWTWGVVDTFAHWVWDQVRPKLDWVADRVADWARHLWSQIWPKLDFVAGRVEAYARWVWDLVQPKFQWTWGVIDTFAHWVWDQVEPKFVWTWGVIDTFAHWVWDQVSPKFLWTWGVIETFANWLWDRIDPVLDFIWNDIIKRTDDVVVNVLNEAANLGETVINTGIAGAQAIGGGFQDALRWLFEHVFDPVADSIAAKMGIPRKLATGQYHTIEELLDDFEDPFPLGGMAAFLVSLLGAVVGLVPALMDVGRIQFQETSQVIAMAIGLTIPTFADLRDAHLRGLEWDKPHDEWLGRAGFSQANIDIIKELYFDIPTPSDLVRFAVREVFSPDVVERFGLFDEFPPDFAKWAEQTGISEFWAKSHWGAHWRLPSVQQAFAMLHRTTDDPLPGGVSGSITVDDETFDTVLSRETLDLLLRTQDIMPFWREPLTRIAYRVASRIDIRRMYRTGVVDRREVLSTYLSLGYEPRVALALTDYVTREASGLDKDAPRETIVSAYRDRLILRGEAETALEELDFSPEAIALFLEQADYAVEKQNTALAEDIVEADVKAHSISEAAARAQLAELGIPPARIDLLIGLWSRKAAVRTLTLSGAQLLRLHREGLMPEATLRERLSALGYNETDVDYLVQLAPPEPPAEPRTLSQAQIRAALREGVIDVAEFTSRLEDLGYPPEDISILLDLEQPEELVVVKVLTVSQLQRAFRQGLIDEGVLRERLAERGYPPAAVDVLVALAQPEVAVRVRELTVSQLQRTFRQGLISAADLHSRLLEMGYTAEAADLLVDLARPPEEAPPRGLSVSQLQRALRGEILTEGEVQAQLIGLGYSAGAVSVLIALARPEELVLERDLTIAQDQKAFREGLIPEDELRRRLIAMGFSALDVDILVELARPEAEVRARELTTSQLQRSFRQGLISEAVLRARLRDLDYTAEAVDLLVQLARPPEEGPP